MSKAPDQSANANANATHVGGDTATAAAAGGVQGLQLGDDVLKLTNQLSVGGGAELRLEVLQTVHRDGLPGLLGGLGAGGTDMKTLK